MKNKKIIILALVLLIIAGIIVVGLKGFSVDFMLKAHDSIEYKFSEEYDISDVENIAKDVFKDKKFKVRNIEVFSDAVSINAEKITTEEAEKLVKALDEKYKKTENTENAESSNEATKVEIISNPRIRLLSLVKFYIVPSIISGVIILLYTAVRYKKLDGKKVVLSLIALVGITVLSILSVIAITRFTISIWTLPAILSIVLFEIVLFYNCKEKKLEELNKQ